MSLIDRLSEASEIMRTEKVWRGHDGVIIDRRDYLSSSEVMRCLRHSWAEKNDVERDEDYEEDWGFAERGHGVEAYIIEALGYVMDIGEDLDFTGDDQRSFHDPEKRVSATPDGLYIRWRDVDDHIDVETCALVEVKSIDPRTNWDKLPRAAHVVQCNIALGLVRRFSNFQPDRTRLIYIDASQYTKQVEYVIDYDDGKALANAAKRAEILFNPELDMQAMPAEGVRDGGCKFCPYKTACGAAGDYAKTNQAKKQRAEPKDLDGLSAELLILGRQYLSAKVRLDMAKDMMDELKASILDQMGNLKTFDVAKEFTIKAASTAGRITLKRDKIEEKFGDLTEFEKIGAPSVRLTIKET